VELVGFIGLIELIELIGLIEFVELIGLVGFVELIELRMAHREKKARKEQNNFYNLQDSP